MIFKFLCSPRSGHNVEDLTIVNFREVDIRVSLLGPFNQAVDIV